MIELLRKRRSIRSYIKEPVHKETVDILVEALLRAPTSRNLKPWSFVVVDDRQLLAGLSQAKEHGSAFLGQAPLGIVIFGDPALSDVWIEDCSIAGVLVQSVAQSMGLGSCWIQIRERRHDAKTTAEEHVRNLLGVPDHLRVASIIALGHPNGSREPVPAHDLDYHKVKHDRYSEGWK